MTPMIEFSLVLLIVFMVTVSAKPRRERGIGRQQVAMKAFRSCFAAIFANGAQRVLFVKGDDRRSFNEIAESADRSISVGLNQVDLMPRRIASMG